MPLGEFGDAVGRFFTERSGHLAARYLQEDNAMKMKAFVLAFLGLLTTAIAAPQGSILRNSNSAEKFSDKFHLGLVLI
jgi:hypothetical protein